MESQCQLELCNNSESLRRGRHVWEYSLESKRLQLRCLPQTFWGFFVLEMLFKFAVSTQPIQTISVCMCTDETEEVLLYSVEIRKSMMKYKSGAHEQEQGAINHLCCVTAAPKIWEGKGLRQ